MAADSAMRDLTRSAFTLPWAVSLFGLQQMVNLAGLPAGRRFARATAALEAATRATHQRLDPWPEQTVRVIRTMHRGLAALTRLRPPTFETDSLMRLAADPRLAPVLGAAAEYAMPPIVWLDSLRVARDDGPALLQEVANKLRVLRLVSDARSDLGLDDADQPRLARLIDRAAGLEPFARLWAVEALGTYEADRELSRNGRLDREGLLSDGPAAGLPSWSLPMLHAGMGLSFAADALAGLAATSTPDTVRRAITRFASLCRRSSHQGYAGAAFESLGFAARAWRRQVVPLLDREIPQNEPGLHGFFWHGAGRAMYFDPAHLLPSSNAPRSMIVQLEQEAPHEAAYRNALAGIAWEATLANMQHPEVLEVFLQYHGTLAAANDAFSNGVSSAVVVRRVTTQDEADVKGLMDYSPRSGATGAGAWRSLVATPCRAALARWCGERQGTDALEELFHYRLRLA